MSKHRKAKWDSTAIVQLPFVPFSNRDDIEKGVLDYIAKRLISIARNERREHGMKSINLAKNFIESRCIVGIDIAGIFDSQVSYLEILSFLKNVYPFVLINSNIKNENLRSLGLHRSFFDLGYILPVFNLIPPEDPLWSSKFNGGAFYDLIKGEKKKISLGDVPSLDTKIRVEDFLRRYKGLEFDEKNGTLECDFSVNWLGVDSPNIIKGLNYLFNKDGDEYDIDEFTKKFDILPEEMQKYLKKSMLFDLLEDDKFSFRLLRENVIPSFMKEMAKELEQKLVTCGSIDTSYSEYATFPSGLVEYHSLGELFESRDTYSLTLLCHVRQQLQEVDYSCIALIDNGRECVLYDLLPKILDNIRVIKVVNYFGQPVISPFEGDIKDEKILVITDLINTGRFLRESLRLLSAQSNNIVRGVYCFLLDINFSSKSLYGDNLVASDGYFGYYVNKELLRVSRAKKAVYESRFGGESSETFQLFWELAGRIISSHQAKCTQDITMRIGDDVHFNGRSIRTHNMTLKDNLDSMINNRCPLYGFLQKQIEKHNITVGVLTKDSGGNSFSKVLLGINKNLKTCVVDPKNREFPEFELFDGKDRFGIFCLAIDTGQGLSHLVSAIKAISSNIEIHVISLLKRNNVIPQTNYYAKEIYKEKLSKQCESISYFYESHLPYYLQSLDSSGIEHFSRKIEEQIKCDPMKISVVDKEGVELG